METTLNNTLVTNELDPVRSFIKDVGLPFNLAPEALCMKPSEFMSWWSGHKAEEIQTRNINSLGKFLCIDENQIMTGTYDKNLVRSRLFHDPLSLPEQYSDNQFSFLRSSAHIVEYLTLSRGQHYSDMIMRKLNVNPMYYASHDHKISLNYFIDLLDTLATHGLTQLELDNLACVLFLSIADTPLGEKFKKAKSYFECYEVMAHNVHLFDQNFEYNFELDRQRFHVHATLHFDKHSQVKWSQEKLQRLHRYRQIMVAWLPFLSKLPPVYPKTSLFFSADKAVTVYTVDFKDKESNSLFCVHKA